MIRVLAPLVLLLAAGPTPAADLPTELTDYVGKKDDSFAWKLAGKKEKSLFGKSLGTVYTIELVSQTWHGHRWTHTLQVYVPKDVKPQPTMVLWNEGDEPEGEARENVGLMLAAKIGSPVAFLFGIPKQPIYGLTEDKLIAESFVRYLTTEDPSWPLLFPMVKSLVRAMDALQAFAKAEWRFDVKDFVVTGGASKRGWTTWLTAATGDRRVKAIAPLVFDNLNFTVQMANQVKSFGKFSDMIRDYEDRLLIPIPRTAAAQRLWHIIDPWTYRERYTMPMMIVNGTNDEYWLLDGLHTYWDGLPGRKWVLYVPNAGHYLCPRDRNGVEEQVPLEAIGTLCAFAHAQVFDKPLPKLDCTMLCPPGAVCLDVNLLCDVKPKAARLYCAEADTRDFRKCWWEAKPLALDGGKTACKVDLPDKGFAAGLVELEFELDGLTFHLSTPPRILEAKK